MFVLEYLKRKFASEGKSSNPHIEMKCGIMYYATFSEDEIIFHFNLI